MDKKMNISIMKAGRPLEQARLQQVLEGGHEEDVLVELFRFQNPDGGFGHGLEPDCQNPNASPIQTWAAMTVLRKIPFDRNDLRILSMFRYLEKTLDPETLTWPAKIPSNNDYPCAPWWKYREEDPSYNPTASIAGFVVRYANPASDLFRMSNKICRQALDFINETHKPIEVHELRCLLDMMNDTKDLYATYPPYKKAKAKMILLIDETLEHDPSKWFTSYVAKPSQLIKDHPSVGSDAYYDLMIEELTLAMKHRNEEGIWTPTFSWGNPDADQAWKAIIAIDYLELMKAFGFEI